jgi:hypothetical protein
MWNVLSDGNGNLQLLPVGEPVPDGWTIEAVTANPNYLDPVPTQRVITKYQFRQRFTFAERGAIDTSTDVNVVVMRNDFNAAEEIDLDNQEVIDGVAYFEQEGLIAPGRGAEIRA